MTTRSATFHTARSSRGLPRVVADRCQQVEEAEIVAATQGDRDVCVIPISCVQHVRKDCQGVRQGIRVELAEIGLAECEERDNAVSYVLIQAIVRVVETLLSPPGGDVGDDPGLGGGCVRCLIVQLVEEPPAVRRGIAHSGFGAPELRTEDVALVLDHGALVSLGLTHPGGDVRVAVDRPIEGFLHGCGQLWWTCFLRSCGASRFFWRVGRTWVRTCSRTLVHGYGFRSPGWRPLIWTGDDRNAPLGGSGLTGSQVGEGARW